MNLEQVAPWGRFKLVSRDITDESDHIYFRNKITTIGRNKRRCDLVIDKLFISSVHCMVKLDDTDDSSEPIVTIHDNSRNGIWVNANRIGKGTSVTLDKGCTIHFTKPGATPAGVTPMAYKFEFLNNVPCSNSHGSPIIREESEVRKDMVDMTVVAEKVFETTHLTTPLEVPFSIGNKRKRENEAAVHATVAPHGVKSRLNVLECQVEATKSKLEGAEIHAATIINEQEQNMRDRMDRLVHENSNLMSELEAAMALNRQLKTELAAKDDDIAGMINEAIKKIMAEKKALEEALAAKNKAMEADINEAVIKRVAADQKVKANEFVIQLNEATKKHQHRIEAESFEQRREMSEKMAAYANDNEKLQAMLDTKEEKLIECEDQIASLKEKVNGLNKKISDFTTKQINMGDFGAEERELEEKVKALSAKQSQLVEFKQKLGELEDKISVMNDENSEIVRLLTAAGQKLVTTEKKVTEASLAAAKANSGTDAKERHELQNTITSLRTELSTIRASQKVELQQEAANIISTTTATPVSSLEVAIESIAPGDDQEALRTRLATALNLFSQVQALGLQGVSLISGTNTSQLKDLHLSSGASVESARAVALSPSTSPMKDTQPHARDPVNHLSKVMTEKEGKQSANKGETETDHMSDNVDEAAAGPKASPSELKESAKNHEAPLSATIEAHAASAIAAMASDSSRFKNSLSDVGTVEGDWEMLQ